MKSRFFYCLLLLSGMMMRGRADCIVSNNPAVLNPYDPATENCTSTNPGQNVTLCSLESSLRLDGYGCPCAFAAPCAFSPGQVPLADNPRFLWIDADGDGQGARGSAPVRRCTTGGGYVDNDWDCDDTNPAIFRGVALCRSRHPSSLATIYPDLNITSSPFTTISAACSPIASVQRWGTSVSVHGTVLAMSSPCRNVAVFFNWDDVAKQWVYQTNTQIYPCSGSFCAGGPILGSPGYGRSLSAWDPFAMISSGTDNATDGLVVGFDIVTHVGAAPWSRICCVASQTTIRQDSTNAATSWPHVQVANTRTVACYQGNAGGNSTAELGEIISNTYVPNDLCGCTGAACPTAWEAFRGATNVCGASGLGLGKQCAIDRADGTQAVFADLNNNLYFFNFTSQWNYIGQNVSANPSGTPVPNDALGMYGNVVAFGFPQDSPSNPTPVVGGSCIGANKGYLVYLIKDGTGTWNLQSRQLFSPSVCAGDFCGTTVRVARGGHVLFSCPQTGNSGGNRYGYVVDLAVLAAAGGAVYPNEAQLWIAPYDQRGDGTGSGLGAVNFGEGLDASDERYAFGSSEVATNGFNLQGRIWVSRCQDEFTCAV